MKDMLREVLEFKSKFLKRHGVKGEEIPAEKRKEWAEKRQHRFGVLPPKARKYSGKIVAWMMWWPWSMLWTLLDDFIVRVYQEIFDLFRRAFQGVSNWAFSSVSPDLLLDEEEEE